MLFMKFKQCPAASGIMMATNCPVELDILKVTNIVDGLEPYVKFVVSTAQGLDTLDTWEEAVKFAEYKYGVFVEMGEAV